MKRNNKRYIYKSKTVKCDEFNLIIKNGEIFIKNSAGAIVTMELYRNNSMFELEIIYENSDEDKKYTQYLTRATVFIDNVCILNGIHVMHSAGYVRITSYYQIRNKNNYNEFVRTLYNSIHTMDIYVTYTDIPL